MNLLKLPLITKMQREIIDILRRLRIKKAKAIKHKIKNIFFEHIIFDKFLIKEEISIKIINF